MKNETIVSEQPSISVNVNNTAINEQTTLISAPKNPSDTTGNCCAFFSAPIKCPSNCYDRCNKEMSPDFYTISAGLL